jgi:alpha-tubulin suppressor-like RCC1 family protein
VAGTLAGTQLEAFAAPVGGAAAPFVGTVYAWGFNVNGQVDPATVPAARAAVGIVAGVPGTVRQVTSGSTSYALLADGTVRAWGNDDAGDLGNGTISSTPGGPVQVSGLTGVTQVAAGVSHVLALTGGGSVSGWGFNSSGELGANAAQLQPVPVQIPGLSGIVQVASGADHSLALGSDGTVWAWGNNFDGQLGDAGPNRSTPTRVPGLSGVVQITAGYFFSMALRSDGTVWAWGDNAEGDLGLGSSTQTNTPTRITALSGVTQISGGFHNAMALTGANGAVWAWGRNSEGAVGDGTRSVPRLSPVAINLTGVTQISEGAERSVALLPNGTLMSWGQNEDFPAGGSSPLGVGSTADFILVPTPVVGLTDVHQVSALLNTIAVAGPSPTTVPVPNLIGDTQSQVIAALQTAGLTLGTVTRAIDPTCRHIGVVSGQNPAAGQKVNPGTRVNIAIGEPPRTACP